MISFQFSMHRDFVEWRYGDLYVLGIDGRCDTSLGLFERLCSHPDLEFGKVKPDTKGLSLGAFSTALPIVDIDISRRDLFEDTSIIAYSLDSKETKELIEFIEKKSEFKRESFYLKSFAEEMTDEIINGSLSSYESCVLASSVTGISFEGMFAMPRYVSFLETYEGLSRSDAFKIAEKRFLKDKR